MASRCARSSPKVMVLRAVSENFLEGQLFKRFLDSPTATPSKEFLHCIGENSYSSDDSKESRDVVCVCLKQ